MIILQINAVNTIRSTGRQVSELSNFLLKSGNESYIAYSYGQDLENGYKIGSKIDHKIHSLLSRIFGLQGYFSKISTKKLLKYIESIKPDVVHLHNLHSNYVNLNMLLNYLGENNISTVITLHDCWFYTGKCTHYTIDNCYKWKDQCGNCPRLSKDNKSWIFDKTTKMLSDKKRLLNNIPNLGIVGVSDWITEEAKKSILKNSKSITRIYNWIDTNTFNPSNNDQIKQKLGLSDKCSILGVSS